MCAHISTRFHELKPSLTQNHPTPNWCEMTSKPFSFLERLFVPIQRHHRVKHIQNSHGQTYLYKFPTIGASRGSECSPLCVFVDFRCENSIFSHYWNFRVLFCALTRRDRKRCAQLEVAILWHPKTREHRFVKVADRRRSHYSQSFQLPVLRSIRRPPSASHKIKTEMDIRHPPSSFTSHF